MPKAIATKTTALRRTTANEKRTTKLLTSGPTHSRHVTTVHDECDALTVANCRARWAFTYRAAFSQLQACSSSLQTSTVTPRSRYRLAKRRICRVPTA